jgi:hypothetical protein
VDIEIVPEAAHALRFSATLQVHTMLEAVRRINWTKVQWLNALIAQTAKHALKCKKVVAAERHDAPTRRSQ